MMYLDMFVKRLEGNVNLLLMCRNLIGYALASSTGHESQTVITRISQRLNVAIGGLTSIVEEIRRHNPEPKPMREPGPVDHTAIMRFLSPVERADLGQLEHSFSELTIARDLVDKFRRRIISIGQQRRQAGDGRG